MIDEAEIMAFEESYEMLFPAYKSARIAAGLKRPIQDQHYKDCLAVWLARGRMGKEIRKKLRPDTAVTTEVLSKYFGKEAP